MDTLTVQQKKIIEGIINDGSIYRGLESSMKARERDGYLLPWHTQTAYNFSSLFAGDFMRDYSLRKTILEVLEERGELIFYNRKEVGSLIRYNGGSYQGCILADYLISATSTMNLDNAQINELERLLNKAKKSLNITLPVVPKPTDQDMQNMLISLALEVIKSKPKHFHQRYLDNLSAQGTPSDIGYKEFHSFAEKVFTP